MALSPPTSRGLSSAGGTITGPLIIDLTADTSDRTALDVVQPDTFGFGARPFRFRQEDFGYLEMLTTGVVSVQGNDFATAGGTISLGGASTDGKLSLLDSSGALILRLDRTRGIGLLLHAAPADASLSNGEAVLWYDQTNGAAKLMVKAKTANGTVVTGQLALA